MSQHNDGSSSVPMKQKRGRPCKEESAARRENMIVPPNSGSVVDLSQETLKAKDYDDSMLGKTVNVVITGTFDAGYLIKAQMPGVETLLSGYAFIPGQFTEVSTDENRSTFVDPSLIFRGPITRARSKRMQEAFNALGRTFELRSQEGKNEIVNLVQEAKDEVKNEIVDLVQEAKNEAKNEVKNEIVDFVQGNEG